LDDFALCHFVRHWNRIAGVQIQLLFGSEAHMAFNEPANPKVAYLASQGLLDPASLTLDDVRAICATALARVPDHRRNEIVQSRPAHEQIDMALAVARYWPDEAA
jgi:hypothetical protein